MNENTMLSMENALGSWPYMQMKSLQTWKLQMVSCGISMQKIIMAGKMREAMKIKVEVRQQSLKENDAWFQYSS